MGKLGGGELNYSSDIDLILLYDPRGRRSAATARRRSSSGWPANSCAFSMSAPATAMCFASICGCAPIRARRRWRCRFAAALDLLRERRAELGTRRHDQGAPGRRRPAAGAPVSARAAAVHLAQESRFRGDRRTSIRSSARSTRIKAAARIAVAGHDIKLGRGGIREIEFFAQTQQLIWGGRLPGCASARPATRCAGWPPPAGSSRDRGDSSTTTTASCAVSSTGCRWSTTSRPIACPPTAPGSSGSPHFSAMRTPMFRRRVARSPGLGRGPLCRAVRGSADPRRPGQPRLHRRRRRSGDAAKPWRGWGSPTGRGRRRWCATGITAACARPAASGPAKC